MEGRERSCVGGHETGLGGVAGLLTARGKADVRGNDVRGGGLLVLITSTR